MIFLSWYDFLSKPLQFSMKKVWFKRKTRYEKSMIFTLNGKKTIVASVGPTWPEIGPTWPQHPPTAEPHKINMIWLDIWRKICVVTSLTFRSQMSQIFNRQHSIFCYPSFVNRKSFKMTSRSIWLDAYFNV